MVSLISTNNGFALAALRRVNNEINETQNRIASGYKVSSAKDNAGVWATATKLRGDITTNETIKGGIATAKAQADSGIAALDEISSLVDEVAKIVTAAKAAGAASASQIAAIAGYDAQIANLAGSAKYAGKNVLETANNLSAALPYSDGASAGTITYTSADFVTAGEFANLTAATDSTKVLALDVGKLYEDIAGTSAKLGAFSKAAEGTLNFVDKLADIQSSVLGSLVDADLERESAKIQALQVRQQLAYQAMAMTNNSAQNILMLFR
ncbi:flagellin [Aureimonas sp. ME7]|uniref:flagellin n=1 Tax=Aureimonas sp. ME7 TaxID=2744252 RepID=UPI0015F355C7|nr:flagellin [Aureimonas sp. ME7]